MKRSKEGKQIHPRRYIYLLPRFLRLRLGRGWVHRPSPSRRQLPVEVGEGVALGSLCLPGNRQTLAQPADWGY